MSYATEPPGERRSGDMLDRQVHVAMPIERVRPT